MERGDADRQEIEVVEHLKVSLWAFKTFLDAFGKMCLIHRKGFNGHWNEFSGVRENQ